MRYSKIELAAFVVAANQFNGVEVVAGDLDGDGVLNDVDNCVSVPNADQLDSDVDAILDEIVIRRSTGPDAMAQRIVEGTVKDTPPRKSVRWGR